jgi:hypothetical protein
MDENSLRAIGFGISVLVLGTLVLTQFGGEAWWIVLLAGIGLSWLFKIKD